MPAAAKLQKRVFLGLDTGLLAKLAEHVQLKAVNPALAAAATNEFTSAEQALQKAEALCHFCVTAPPSNQGSVQALPSPIALCLDPFTALFGKPAFAPLPAILAPVLFVCVFWYVFEPGIWCRPLGP